MVVCEASRAIRIVTLEEQYQTLIQTTTLILLGSCLLDVLIYGVSILIGIIGSGVLDLHSRTS